MQNQAPTPLQATLGQAEQALVQGDFRTCAARAEAVLQRDAVNVAAHLFRGVASNQLGDLERAITDLVFVLERQPDNVQAAFHLGQALRKNGQFDPALARLKPALDVPALRPHALFEIARCFRGLGRFNKAIDHYKLLLQETPEHADAAANLAMLLEQTSRLEEARAWAERATVLAPGNVAALLTRARVLRRLGRFDEAVHQLDALATRDLPPMTRVIAANEQAQCLDRLGRHEEAFSRFTEANQLQQAHDPEAGVDDYGSYGIELVHFLKTWLRSHPVAKWSPTPPDDRDAPVFLVGFPRSGTTLLDQVLSAHPKIEVLEEQELLLEVRRRWIVGEDFERLQDMTETEVLEARRLYRQARAAAHANPDAEVVVDKLPLNSIYLPLIHRLFPEAKILFALRDPRDVCLSCYFQTFSLVGAMPYFLELDSTARYYDAVMSLATEAREALPLDELEIRYDRLVDDLEGEARRIVTFLDLPWNDAVLDYRSGQSERDINTPSYQQVSEPLYRRSVGRWRNYAPQLAEVEPILAPWVETLGYGDA